MSRLKIYFDCDTDRTSEYYPETNEIYINPLYYDHSWIISLMHEIMHWLICKLPCTIPKTVGLAPIWIFNLKLDVFHAWLMDKMV